MTVRREDWNFVKKNLFKYKQGKNKSKSEETTVLMVKDLQEYIIKLAENESKDLDLSMEKLPVCFDADAGGGRFVASFAFLNRTDSKIVLHPFIIYEGSDCRDNLEMTLGEFTETIRKLEGEKIQIGHLKVEINQYGLFDLAALNTIVGKQNHSSSFPCAWTNVSKDHLKSDKHKHKYHTAEDCKSISFLTNEDYETMITNHVVKGKNKEMAKSGKDFGSIVAINLMPFKTMSRYIPPLMHIIMGETNNLLKELKAATIKADSDENVTLEDDEHSKTQEVLIELYKERENLTSEWKNVNFAELLVLNDLRRVELLSKDDQKKASNIAVEIVNGRKKRLNAKEQCGADLCLLFASDVENELDTKITCINTCEIHVRCEGLGLTEEVLELAHEYECVKCKKGLGNRRWIQEALEKRIMELCTVKSNLSTKLTNNKAKINIHENIEAECIGPKQRQLKEAMKVLGDVARYHGGDLQGKQVQKLLDNARGEAEFKLLECISDDEVLHSKFKNGITILANISDALKMPLETFDDQDVKVIGDMCKEWGKFWPVEFPHRNITPKGHIMSFVLPEIISKLRTFYRFYKVEQKGDTCRAQ